MNASAILRLLKHAESVSNGGKLYGEGSTVPTGTGYAKGAIFQHTDGSGLSDLLYVNNGTTASADFQPVGVDNTELLASTSNGEGAALVGIEDSGGFTSSATVEAALAEIYQHIVTTQAFIGIPLNTWREATNFDVGAITANGGVLASDTTPVLDAINAATDGCQRILWAASNNDQIVTSIPLPPDLDTSADLVLHTRIVSGGTTDAVGFTVDTFFNEGDTKVSDTSGTNQTTTYSEALTTIAAADVPSGAQTLTIGLTPVAHTTDTLAMTSSWLEYSRSILTA